MKEQVKCLLQKLNLKILKESRTHFFISCPFSARHEGGLDTNPSFSIEFKAPFRVHCFGCGWSAKHIKTFVNSMSYIRQEDYSSLITDFEIPNFEQIDEPEVKRKFDSLSFSHKNRIWQKTYHPYLAKRGILETSARVWGLGFDAYRQNVTFPIYDKDMNLCGITGRAVENKGHFNYFFSKEEYIFGEQFIGGKTIVVEGQTDCVRLWQFLAQNNLLDDYSVVCTMGAAPSSAQADRIVAGSNEIIIFYDFDKAGKKGTEQLKRLIGNRLFTTEINYSLLDLTKYGDLSIRSNKIDPDKILQIEPEKVVKLLKETKL